MFVGMASRVFLISDYEHWLLNYMYTTCWPDWLTLLLSCKCITNKCITNHHLFKWVMKPLHNSFYIILSHITCVFSFNLSIPFHHEADQPTIPQTNRPISPSVLKVLPRIPGMQPVVWSSLLQAGLQLPLASEENGKWLQETHWKIGWYV